MTRRRSEITGDVRLGAGVRLGDGCRLLAVEGPIVIGDGSVLGDGCRLVAHERIDIGRRCRLGDGVVIQDFAPVWADSETPVRSQGLRTRPVRVGDDAILEPGACLGPGAAVTAGAVVGAHVVVDPLWPRATGAAAGGAPASGPSAAGRRP